MQENVVQAICEEKIIVIARGIYDKDCLCLARALYDGGIRLMEVTFDPSQPLSYARTADTVAALVKEFSGKMLVGAGTVLDEATVELAAGSGARFIVSPDTNERVIARTRELGLASLPGAMTPTEIASAHRFGADFVKVFPASQLGSAYFKAVLAPLSHVRLLAVGGVDENNIAEYLRAGAVGAGIGSNLANKRLVEAGAYGQIAGLAQAFRKAAGL